MLKPSVAIAATRVSAGSTDELDHVVQLVLSRFLAGTRAKNPVATNRLCRGLALAGREAVPGVDAAVPFPELRPGPWPTADPPPAVLTIRDSLRRQALAAGAVFIDPIAEGWFVGRPDLIGGDGVHPTDAGHAYMAERIAPLIYDQLFIQV